MTSTNHPPPCKHGVRQCHCLYCYWEIETVTTTTNKKVMHLRTKPSALTAVCGRQGDYMSDDVNAVTCGKCQFAIRAGPTGERRGTYVTKPMTGETS